jgi:hypothetical protein
MNREIKFRAWTGKQFEYDFNMYSNGNAIDIDVPKHLPSRLLNWQLCQFTGLQDKNGIDIYEGDIVSGARYLEPCKIVFKKGMFHAVGEDIAGDCVGYYRGEYEVIGNIYENPEFLDRD